MPIRNLTIAIVLLVLEEGTTLPSAVHVPARTATEHWQGFPAMRDDYFAARVELRRRVDAVVARLSAAR